MNALLEMILFKTTFLKSIFYDKILGKLWAQKICKRCPRYWSFRAGADTANFLCPYVSKYVLTKSGLYQWSTFGKFWMSRPSFLKYLFKKTAAEKSVAKSAQQRRWRPCPKHYLPPFWPISAVCGRRLRKFLQTCEESARHDYYAMSILP